ncbi:MAG: DsbA family oxidoreductase [Gammaproteobacteria bacterium]|nr:DsbA family oxidoreductase [Gammaproteobacteria bacterium]
MQVEIWSDIYCPFCGLGDFRLRQALQRFAHAPAVRVVHRSFQLDPGIPEGRVLSSVEYLRDAKGADPEQVQAIGRELERGAAGEGLAPYHVTDNDIGNTRLAHEFLAFATEQGRNAQAWQRMFTAYFGERAPVWSVDDLVSLGAGLGLDAEETRAALVSGRYTENLRQDHQAAVAHGARGVPFFLFDGRHAVFGAQPVERLLGVLERAWDERGRGAR